MFRFCCCSPLKIWYDQKGNQKCRRIWGWCVSFQLDPSEPQKWGFCECSLKKRPKIGLLISWLGGSVYVRGLYNTRHLSTLSLITQFWQGILASIEEKIKTYEIDQREKRASTIRGWVDLLSLYSVHNWFKCLQIVCQNTFCINSSLSFWEDEVRCATPSEPLTLKDFKLKATLGRGAFGKVVKVKKKRASFICRFSWQKESRQRPSVPSKLLKRRF